MKSGLLALAILLDSAASWYMSVPYAKHRCTDNNYLQEPVSVQIDSTHYTLFCPLNGPQVKSASMMGMPLRSTKRRLKLLWRNRRELDARIDEAIRRRLQRFRKGFISSEEFERGTREERKFDRLGELILKIEEKTKPRNRYTKSTLPRR